MEPKVQKRPKSQPRRQVRKQTAKELGQQQLIDEFGYPRFCVKDEMVVIDAEAARFVLGGMTFEFAPLPNDSDFAMRMTIDALLTAYVSYRTWRARWPKVEMESWFPGCVAFVVSSRSKSDDDIVRSTFDRERRILNLSVPHSTRWRASGLYWIATYDRCCTMHSMNPAPWKGKKCECS